MFFEKNMYIAWKKRYTWEKAKYTNVHLLLFLSHPQKQKTNSPRLTLSRGGL